MLSLSWTGFLAISLVYRVIQLISLDEKVTFTKFKDIALSRFSQKYLILHHIFRTLNWLVYIWLLLIVSDYCFKAQINPGIVYSCFSISIIFTSLISYILFNENLTRKMCLGIGIVILGVIWISISKNSGFEVYKDSNQTNDRVVEYRIKAILLAIFAGLIASARPI